MSFQTLAVSLVGALSLWPFANAAVFGSFSNDSSCKAIPGDNKWPTLKTWSQLNETIDGRLISTIPQAAVCHPEGFGPIKYDETACTALEDIWNAPMTFEPFSGEIMNPWYQNVSCSPYYDLNNPCVLGNYVSYAINISGPSDIVAGIKFSQENNVRLVIKNTGHDFLGKSTGKGGLSLWTHNLQNMEIISNYDNNGFAAIKIGAGRTGGEALLFAHSAGYRLVTGDCPTVGVAGGYSAGGGHGYLNGAYGMASDNVLEWEVVTADGRHLIATPTENQDLYWALSGGGAGTYAVALSMTTKIYPDLGPIGAATLSFNTSSSPNNESYATAIQGWWQFLPSVVDTGATVDFNLVSGSFLLYNITALNTTAEEVDIMFQPYLSQLQNLSIGYTFETWAAPNYVTHYNNSNGPLPNGIYEVSELFNSRLIPRAVSENATRAAELTSAMITAMNIDRAADWNFGCMGLNVNQTRIQHPDNGVTPHWRNAIAICLEFSNYDWTIPQSEMIARRTEMANIIHPMIEAVTPDSGAYLNEADPLVYPPGKPQKWQDAFYGANYAQLRQMKDKWDPESVFYAYTAVGSEDWVEDSEGRLCKA